MSSTSHGSSELPSVVVDDYNVELRDETGAFLGDRGSKRAFHAIVDDWRDRLEDKNGDGDPLGDDPTHELSKKKLDRILLEGDPEAAGLVLGAIEEFAQDMATIVRRFMRLKDWKGTQRIVVGGGFRDSRMGELAVGRATVILKAGGVDLTLVPIRHHPDEAGLIGAAHLMPSWMFSGHDSLIGVDIGGSNIRVGIVCHNLKRKADLSKAEVWRSELWRHRNADERAPSRKAAIERLVAMIRDLLDRAVEKGLNPAPFIGVGCPGLIQADGQILRGGQNLPGGNWESKGFNLADSLREAIPRIGEHETIVILHNDAVVQGLSEIPVMQDVARWGVFTIGTGLGNARFSNRAAQGESKDGEGKSGEAKNGAAKKGKAAKKGSGEG